MQSLRLLPLRYTVTSPHKPGEVFIQSGLFSSRAWFQKCLAAWNICGYTYTETPADRGANELAECGTYLAINSQPCGYQGARCESISDNSTGWTPVVTADRADELAKMVGVSVEEFCSLSTREWLERGLAVA